VRVTAVIKAFTETASRIGATGVTRELAPIPTGVQLRELEATTNL
jgi:hypothetical protein